MYFDENNNYFDLVSNEYEYESNKYIDKSKINNFDIDIDSINFKRNNELYSVMEGFNKGNMFEQEYVPYKNYIYKLKVNNKRDELLYQIQMYMFAMKDLNLFLDLHPNDKEKIKLFLDYKNKCESLKKKYEEDYGPLCISDIKNSNTWEWINNPWPWDIGGKN